MFFGKPLGGRRPDWARAPSQSRMPGSVRVLAPRRQVSPSARRNTLASASFAVLEASAAARRRRAQLGHLVEREHQQLAVGADGGDVVAVGRDAEQRVLAGPEVQHLLAGALLGQQVGGGGDEAAAGVGGDEVARAVLPDEQRGTSSSLRHLGHEADRLAVAAAARQVAGAQRVGTAVGGEQAEPVGGLAGHQEAQRVALLELQLRAVGGMAAHGADPAFLGQHDGDRLALDQHARR